MKVALVYDRVNKLGGAEKILLALHRMFPEAPLYTSVYSSENAMWAKDFQVHTSFLQKIPFARTSHEFFAACMPIAFESFDFDAYDLVISVTSESAKGIVTKPDTLHICICLTPTRYLWSGYKEYFSNPFLRVISKPVVAYLQRWDRMAAARPDVMVGISTVVKDRIEKYYNRKAELLYPPVNVHGEFGGKSEEFYLIVSRLVPYKKIDIAIRAANKLRIPLKIIGTGRQEEYLRSISGPTVELLGFLPDDEVFEQYRRCKAFLFPGYEDFGITMVEANAFGKPVIAYGRGGARDIIVEGKTGEFFEKQTVASLVDALKKFDESKYNRKTSRKNAERFKFEIFEKSLRTIIERNMKKE